MRLAHLATSDPFEQEVFVEVVVFIIFETHLADRAAPSLLYQFLAAPVPEK
jgi:hypothetical protein